MDDEFALCWNNFQDNIASGFQNLYDRGDLVDVTLACDGKLLQAHKIVLAICSPYFQEMFITNPCKHPIIVLKDVTYTVMTELLQFMYQGVVNVKHTELSSFMKIAQTLQIKGLATSTTHKSSGQVGNTNSGGSKATSNNNGENQTGGSSNIENKMNLTSVLNPKTENLLNTSTSGNSKRSSDFNFEPFSIYPKKQYKRHSESGEHDMNNDSMEHLNSDEVFLPPIPQISMIESRFDLNSVKRETGDMPASPGGLRNSLPPPFNFEYSVYQSKHVEYPNELHMGGDYPKGAGNHMDIPPGSNITMLSSTSLLHGNCIFNRNNTVATQQGMKTYWLCKSYRITMCRARCITHQGRVISATGVHNHQPHMKSPPNNDLLTPLISSMNTGGPQSGNNSNLTVPNPCNTIGGPSNMRIPQNPNFPQHHPVSQQQQQHLSHHPTQQYQPSHHQMHHPPGIQGHHQYPSNNAAVIQNMMQNVLSQNNLMHLTNMAPMLNTLSQHSPPVNSINPPSSLQITPVADNTHSVTSPAHRNNTHAHTSLGSPNIHPTSMASPSHNNSSNNNNNSSNSNNNSSNNTNNSNNNNNNSNNTNMTVTSSLVPVSSSSPGEDNCPSVSQDSNHSSQSNIISSITISPTQPSFKMEHI